MVLKVKEPLEPEYSLLREGQTIFTYLHLAPDIVQADALLRSKVTAIAYETVELEDGTLPLLAPMMTMMLILAFGSLMSVSFERVLALQNDLNLSVSEVISTYTYKVGLIQNDMGFSAAIGLFNSAVNAVLLLSVNFICNKLFNHSLF